MKYNYKNSKFISFILAVFLLMLSIPLSNIMGFEPLQVKGVCFLFAALILWISDAIPMALATLLLIFLLPPFGLMEYNDVVGSFGVGTSLFIMASSGITVAIAKSNIPHKNSRTGFCKDVQTPHWPDLLFWT